MSNQILISSGAKLRDLDDVIIGTDGILSSLGFNVANGVPKLDENGKILVSQLPNSVMEFKGVWNAATNTPTLANGTGNAGDVWLCNVAGTVNFGAGPIAFAVGDYAVYTGTVWARSSGATGTVTSVGLSRDGDALSVTGSPITTSGTINIGFAGTNLQYINGAGNLVTFPDLTVYVPTSRTLTINDVTYDLSANRTWTIDSMIYPEEGIAVSTGTAWGDSIVDNSSNWNTAYNNSIVSAEVTGTTTKTLTLDQQDGGTITASWTDYDTAPVTSVFGRTGAVVAVSGDYTTAQVTESGNLYFTDARARLAISLTTLGTSGAATYNNTTGVLNIPNYTTDLTGYVPYTGATTNVNLGVHSLSAYDLIINHTSGSGVAASITKGGAGEALTVVKSSGSGNAASITGGVTLLSELHLTTDLADAYIASAATWNAKQNAITLTTTGSSGASTFISNTLNVPNYTLAGLGGQPLATNLTSLSGLTYASTSFVKMTAAGTFALDPNTYALASALGDYLPLTGGTLTGPLYLTGNTFTFGIVSQATGFDVYSTGNFAPHYSTNFTIYQGAIGSGAARMTMLSTGATTFVSTVTASSLIKSGGTASQYLMADGSVSTLTNPVTGTGTADYLSKFTTASTIAVSSLYENANKIYLNTTTTNAIATSSFTINGGSQAFVLYNGGVNGFLYGSSTAGGIALAATYDLRFETGDAAGTAWPERMRLFRLTGNLSLGYGSAPADSGFKLDVNGTSRFNDVLRVMSHYAEYSDAEFMGALGFNRNPANGVIYNTARAAFQLQNNLGTFQFRVFSGAGADLGTPLSISSTGAATFSSSVTSLAASGVGVIVAEGSATNGEGLVSVRGKNSSGTSRRADFKYDNADVVRIATASPINMQFETNDIPRMTITSGGLIYVNTTTGVSGGGALQVNGNVNINGVFQINGVTIGGGGGSGVTGSGTTNTLTKWTGSTTLGNSLLTDNGSIVTLANGASDEVPLRLSTTTANSRIGFGTSTSGNTYNISTGGYAGTSLGFWTADVIRGHFASNGILNLLYGLTMSASTIIQFAGDTRYGLAKVYNASTGDMFGMEQVGSTQLGFTAAATRIFAANASTNFISLGWYTTATAFTDALRVIIGTGNTILGSGSDNGYKLQINGSASFAYGFLSIFRGSSGANDIFVGNDGSRIYIGGNTYVVGNVTATGGFFDTSDARLKTLVKDNYLLSSIANVKAKLYKKNGVNELGYYAQDLESILPSAVKEGSDGFLSLSYAQVHTAKIAVIEDEVTILKNRVSELETKLKKYDA
jgi:hypothetical protein